MVSKPAVMLRSCDRRRIFDAIASGKCDEECELLIIGINTDIHRYFSDEGTFDRMYSPILIAAEKGRKNVIKLLLSNEANIHETNSHGSSAIMIASSYGHHEVVEMLLSEGASVHDKLTLTAASSLIIASERGHTRVVEILLTKGGADINGTTKAGYSSIMYSCMYNHSSVVKLLLSRGANTHDCDRYGNTCFKLTKSDYIKFILCRWSVTMVILLFFELHVYFQIDCSSIIDLFLYLN